MQLSDSLDKGFNAGVNKHIFSLTVLIVEMLSNLYSRVRFGILQNPLRNLWKTGSRSH
jgi:hypothetical protein